MCVCASVCVCVCAFVCMCGGVYEIDRDRECVRPSACRACVLVYVGVNG